MRTFVSTVYGIVTGLLLLTAPAIAQQRGEVKRERGGYLEIIDKTLQVEQGGTLFLLAERGSIGVDSWDRPQVRVIVRKRAERRDEEEARALFADFSVRIEQQGKDVRVTARSSRSRRLRRLSVDYDITVPKQYNLDLETEGGSIDLGDLQGNVAARTAGGSIRVGYIEDGQVEVQTAGGSIKIRGIRNGDGHAVTSGGSISVGDVSGKLEVETSGGSISIDQVGKSTVARTAGGSITIEESGGDLTAKTAGGSITIDRAGGKTEARTAGGSISLGNMQGDVKAHTAGGSINIDQAGGAVDANTAGGGIHVGGSGGPVVVETAGGSIYVAGARGYIEAETAGGEIEAELVVSDPEIDTHCTLRTAVGDLTIYLPEDLAATFDVELRITRDGWRSWWEDRDEYKITSDFPLTIESDDSGGWGYRKKITATGDINGGGDPIRLYTVNGDIRIRKLR